MNTNDCCIADILEMINKLQCQAEIVDDIPSTCDRPFLGNIISSCLFNTRPVSLYTCNNELITMPYELNGVEGTSSVFRIENVKGCCGTFRVLAPNPDATSTIPYVATTSFFTLNTSCVCALRCLSDTFVECI